MLRDAHTLNSKIQIKISYRDRVVSEAACIRGALPLPLKFERLRCGEVVVPEDLIPNGSVLVV